MNSPGYPKRIYYVRIAIYVACLLDRSSDICTNLLLACVGALSYSCATVNYISLVHILNKKSTVSG